MCDFRDIKEIILPNGERIHSYKNIYPNEMKNINESGLYFIMMTGSHYEYYDGNKWHRDDYWMTTEYHYVYPFKDGILGFERGKNR